MIDKKVQVHKWNSNMNTLYLTIGPPGSGKTYWAHRFVEANRYYRINRDDLRRTIAPASEKPFYTWSGDLEKRVSKIANFSLQTLLAKTSVVKDDTHMNPKTLKGIVQTYNSHPITLVTFLDLSFNQLEYTNKFRENSVPDHVLEKMFNRTQEMEELVHELCMEQNIQLMKRKTHGN